MIIMSALSGQFLRLPLGFSLLLIPLPLGVADAAEGGVLGETLEGGGVGVGKGF